MFQPISQGLYEFKYQAKMMPGIIFPVRSTLIELTKHKALLISPGPFSKNEIDFLSRYPELYCVAPNAFHHLYLSAFHQAVPRVPLYGPEGVKTKQKELAPLLQDISELESIVSPELELFQLEGNPSLQESVFYHPASQTLIVTDLIFNLQSPGFALGLLLRIVGAYKTMAQSKLVKWTTQDQAAFKASLQVLKDLKIQKIVMGHGELITQAAEISMALKIMGVALN